MTDETYIATCRALVAYAKADSFLFRIAELGAALHCKRVFAADHGGIDGGPPARIVPVFHRLLRQVEVCALKHLELLQHAQPADLERVLEFGNGSDGHSLLLTAGDWAALTSRAPENWIERNDDPSVLLGSLVGPFFMSPRKVRCLSDALRAPETRHLERSWLISKQAQFNLMVALDDTRLELTLFF